jgi:hypothetical protein
LRRALLLVLSLAASSASAATHVWFGTASDRFSDAANWSGGSPIGDAQADLLFAATTASRSPRNDVEGLTVRSISISTGGYAITGSAITVTSEVSATTGESTIACELVLASDVSFFVDEIVANVRAGLNLDGAIRGGGRLIKDGGASLRMRGHAPNRYTGGTVVRRGFVILEKGTGITAIPGDVRILATIVDLLAEQIADDAVVTFERGGNLVLERDETVAAVVSLGDSGSSRTTGSALVQSGWAALFVRDVRATGKGAVYADRLHLAAPLNVTLDSGAFFAELTGDAPVTIRGTGESSADVTSAHFSPTFIDNVRLDADLRNSAVTQHGGSFTGKAQSLLLDGGTLSGAGIGGPLVLTAATRVAVGASIFAGPVSLSGATLLADGLRPAPLGTVLPIIRNFSTLPTTGTFAGLPEGAAVGPYTITYHGGDGNDVELRALKPTPEIHVRTESLADHEQLRITVDFESRVFATGPLQIRYKNQLLGTVQLVNGLGTFDLQLPPDRYELTLEYAGDAQLKPVTSTYETQVLGPTPVLTSVEPNVIRSGAGKVTVVIKGSNFIPGASPLVGHSGMGPAEFISSTELHWVTSSRGKGESALTDTFAIWQGPSLLESNSVPFTWEAGPPADPKRLTITRNTITTVMRPGGTVAMMMAGYHPYISNRTLLVDSDGDGKVTWTFTRNLPTFFVCAVVDLQTGDYFLEASPGFDFIEHPLPIALHRGPSGAHSNIVLRDLYEPDVLWVRRGVGAWWVELTEGSDADQSVNGSLLFEASEMTPVGSSPAVPVGVQRGDILIALNLTDAEPFVTTIDDTHFAADVPGTLELPRSISGAEEDRVLRFVVFREDGSAGRVSARVTVVDKTAKGGVDFEPLDRRVTLEAGEMWKAVELALFDDAIFDGGLTFEVRLGEPAGAAIAPLAAQGILGEAEPPPIASVDDVTVREGDGPGVAMTAIRLSAPASLPIEVDWFAYQARGTVVFAPGELRKDIAIPFYGDRIAGEDARIDIELSSDHEWLGTKRGQLTLIDDDSTRISIRDVSVAEGSETRVLELTLDADVSIARTVTVNFATRDVNAMAGSDYTATTGVATFSTFSGTMAKIRIPILGDAIAEGPESFEVVLTNPVGGELARAVARITIADDDAMPAIFIADATSVEGDTATFLIQLSAPAPAPVTISVNTTAGTATSADFTPWSNGIVTIPAGVMATSIGVPLKTDLVAEADETFTVSLSNPVNATLGRATATATILDRPDPPVILSVGDVRVVEGNDGQKTVLAVASVNRPLGERHADVRVSWTTADGTATAGTDYVAAKGELTLLSFEHDKLLTFVVNGDRAAERDETFRIVLSNATGGTVARAEAVVTIVDDDGGARRRAAGRGN